jgi:arylsulfatase A-like enzyme
MKRTAILLTALLAVPALAAEKPNVILVVADDLGYADVGFRGCKDIPTPHLDALAKRGVVCTNGYVTHPFCSPTRAALLTGRYQQRFGHENNPAWLPGNKDVGLPLDQSTLADALKGLGYATGAIGKWHLGAHPSFHPNRRGFDSYFGLLGGGWSPGGGTESPQLYDMASDPGETKNFTATRPEVVTRLTNLLETFVADGRSTRGEKQKNDVDVKIHKSAKK